MFDMDAYGGRSVIVMPSMGVKRGDGPDADWEYYRAVRAKYDAHRATLGEKPQAVADDHGRPANYLALLNRARVMQRGRPAPSPSVDDVDDDAVLVSGVPSAGGSDVRVTASSDGPAIAAVVKGLSASPLERPAVSHSRPALDCVVAAAADVVAVVREESSDFPRFDSSSVEQSVSAVDSGPYAGVLPSTAHHVQSDSVVEVCLAEGGGRATFRVRVDDDDAGFVEAFAQLRERLKEAVKDVDLTSVRDHDERFLACWHDSTTFAQVSFMNWMRSAAVWPTLVDPPGVAPMTQMRTGVICSSGELAPLVRHFFVWLGCRVAALMDCARTASPGFADVLWHDVAAYVRAEHMVVEAAMTVGILPALARVLSLDTSTIELVLFFQRLLGTHRLIDGGPCFDLSIAQFAYGLRGTLDERVAKVHCDKCGFTVNPVEHESRCRPAREPSDGRWSLERIRARIGDVTHRRDILHLAMLLYDDSSSVDDYERANTAGVHLAAYADQRGCEARSVAKKVMWFKSRYRGDFRRAYLEWLSDTPSAAGIVAAVEFPTLEDTRLYAAACQREAVSAHN